MLRAHVRLDAKGEEMAAERAARGPRARAGRLESCGSRARSRTSTRSIRVRARDSRRVGAAGRHRACGTARGMSVSDRHGEQRPAAAACATCLRRSWPLSLPSATLDYRANDCSRLHALLSLDDRRLAARLAGRHAELNARYAASRLRRSKAPPRRKLSASLQRVPRWRRCRTARRHRC